MWASAGHNYEASAGREHVIPAQAGIQVFALISQIFYHPLILDSCFRRSDRFKRRQESLSAAITVGKGFPTAQRSAGDLIRLGRGVDVGICHAQKSIYAII
jgi:hypothetical protein